jgi:hypothetical protein
VEFPFVRLAAHGGEFPMDCRICQTFTASPAEPGDLPEELEAVRLAAVPILPVASVDSLIKAMSFVIRITSQLRADGAVIDARNAAEPSLPHMAPLIIACTSPGLCFMK